MDEHELKEIARQLRKPDGEFGHVIGMKMNESNQDMNRFAIQKLNPTSGDNILEIGMGNGCFVKEILSTDENILYTGADFSDLMVNECIHSNKEWIDKKRASFIKADASELPFDDNTFNKIFTVNTVYFWDNPETILKELHRVLQSRGLLLIVYRTKVSMEQFPFTKYGFNLPNADQVKEMVEQNYFKVADTFIKKESGNINNKNESVEANSEIVITMAEAV